MKHEYKKQRLSLGCQHLREQLMRDAVDRKIEERRRANANEDQKENEEETGEKKQCVN